MRKRLIAGNWKSNLDHNEAMHLVSELVRLESEGDWSQCDVAIMPPSLYTRLSFEFLKNAKSSIQLGVQDCSATEQGAFTGELSTSMIQSAGASLVILGHSERRDLFGENNEALNAKLERCFEARLTPVFCCGEHLEDRKNGTHFEVVHEQLEETVNQLDGAHFSQLVIAYEPVWAIGTGETATPAQAQEMHAFIRGLIQDRFGKALSDKLRILYGGSMKPANAAELLSQPDVDGGLIGGASLKAEDFAAIIQA